MKRLLAAVCVMGIVGFCFSGVLDRKAEVPKGVRYKTAKKADNEIALKAAVTAFQTNRVAVSPLLMPHCICGPNLWAQIRHIPALADLRITPAKVSIPSEKEVTQLEGGLLQRPEEITAFAKTLDQVLSSEAAFEVRRPTSEELRLFWREIPFDIEEPIFVVASPKHRILLLFSAKDPAVVFWIEDMEGMREVPAKEKQ